jgi:hypothetical protein
MINAIASEELQPAEQINPCYFRPVYSSAARCCSNLRLDHAGFDVDEAAVPRPWRRRSAERRRGKAPLCPRGDANSSRARLAGHFFSTHRATKQDMAAPLGLHSRRLLQQILALTLQLIILPARLAARRRR